MDIDSIRTMWQAGDYELSEEVIARMAQREVSLANIEQALMSGSVVEERPRSRPYPKCTVQGWAEREIAGLNIGLHRLNVACGVGDVLKIITVYWEE